MTDRIDLAELIDATEAAAILGLSHRNSVSVYRKRYADFPEPIVEKSRCVLWLRTDIEAWAKARRRGEPIANPQMNPQPVSAPLTME